MTPDYFERLRLLRMDPANCSRCGRPNDSDKATCDRCREKNRRYCERRRAAKRANVETADGIRADIVRRLATLEGRVTRLAKGVRRAYDKGYGAGVRSERRKWQDMPRDWTSWKDPIGIESRKQMCHAIGER